MRKSSVARRAHPLTEREYLILDRIGRDRTHSEGTGYQANLRYGSQQSVTRDWSMPMHRHAVPQGEGRDALRVRVRG